MNRRSRYTAEARVRILREHLENQISVSELSERYNIHPNMVYKWKKELFVCHSGSAEAEGSSRDIQSET